MGEPGSRMPASERAAATSFADSAAVLVGDIGGTNARFAVLAPSAGGRLQLLAEETLPSRRFQALGDAVSAFLTHHPEARWVTRCCLGIAGPVRDDRCEATNLPWVADARRLRARLGLSEVVLLNDLEAAAWGLAQVEPGGVRTLSPGNPRPQGNQVLVAPGTGLGQAVLVWDGERYQPFATEAGHADFGPSDELQVELWRYLRRQFGHVSWERAVSGPGLVSLFRFHLERAGEPEPTWLIEAEAEGRGPEAVTSRARDDRWPHCQATVELFFELLGAEAGNAALRTLSTGGLYLAGGIVPHLLHELEASRFMDAFVAKDRFRALLDEIPVRVVVDPRLALWGAAARLASG